MRRVYYDVIWPVLLPWLSNKCLRRGNNKACKYNRFYSLLAARDTASMAVRNGDRRLYSRARKYTTLATIKRGKVRALCAWTVSILACVSPRCSWTYHSITTVIRELHIIGDAGEHVSVLFLVCSWRHDGYGWQEQKGFSRPCAGNSEQSLFVPTWSFCTTWLTSCKSKGLLRSKSKHDPLPSRKDLSSVFFKRHVVLCPWGVTRYTWIVTKMSAGIN